MANRTRKIQLKICLTDKEKELFEEKNDYQNARLWLLLLENLS